MHRTSRSKCELSTSEKKLNLACQSSYFAVPVVRKVTVAALWSLSNLTRIVEKHRRRAVFQLFDNGFSFRQAPLDSQVVYFVFNF